MLKVVSSIAALMLLSVSSVVTASDAKSELQDKLEQLRSLTADFSQKVSAVNGDVLQQVTGELAIQRPNKMRWKTHPPDDTLMVASGETVWYYNPFVEQVTLYHQQDAAANSPMLLLLTGSDEQWQGYTVTEPEPNVYHITNSYDDSEMRLHFQQETLSRIWLQQQGGDIIELQLNDVQLNPDLDADWFRFTVPDGVDVDDQR